MSQASLFDTKSIYESSFNEALSTLNVAQLEAVKRTEGAVLVVAGPGTGKTQLLAARIGYILKNTDTQAYNILCLTFTDAGAVAMRQRLLKFIGPEAYNVSIFTFHAFCNKVIGENIEHFGGYYDLQVVSELEQVEIVKQIIDEFPVDHELKRFKGNLYFERKPLLDLFSTIKQEGWDTQEIIKYAQIEIEKINDPENTAFIYSRTGKGYKKGERKWKAIKKAEKPYQKIIAAVGEFEKYERLMSSRERFDYNDMILWVIEKFQELPELLMEYQERYQYILVDEYQDTNGSQNQILDLLSSYWDDPNLFAVGDDDQSIYRFQGANMDNIELFKDKYQPKVIVLENNYRSTQAILDSASKLIENNTKRLVNTYEGEFSKNLVASRKEVSDNNLEPKISIYPNITQEEIAIANKIIEFHERGTPLSDVAVIYRNHRNVSNIVKYLEMKEVPLNIKRRLNVLDTPEILRIINILDYIENEGRYIDSANSQLFELLHYEYFGLKARDIGKVAVYCSRRTDEEEDDITWDGALTSKSTLERLKVSDVDKLMATYSLLQKWISDSKNVTIQVLFGKILTEGNIINTVMNSVDKVWRLQLVNTFFDFVKEESVKRPDIKLSDLLQYIEIMNANDIRLPFEKIVSNKEGVNFITAHSSKGLEFKYVFMIRCESKNWEGKRKPSKMFKFPSKFVPASERGDEEDERRLFFVSMTRAKDYLYISYPSADDNEKSLEPSRFLSEIDYPDNYLKLQVEPNEVLEYKANLMQLKQAEIELIDHELIDRILENYSMSVTSLTKYLECPLRFYFENILRVPQARNANTGFGKAMHYALEQLFIKIDDDPQRLIPPKENFVAFFHKGMDRTRSHYTQQEFDNLKVYGEECLKGYYDTYHMYWSNANHYKLEYKIDLTQHEGVPIKGVIDRLSIFENSVEVVDYKTGKYYYASKNMKPPLGDEDIGGRYWRQIVFYKILLDADPKMSKPMQRGIMDFLEKDSNGDFKQKAFEVSDMEIEIVSEQLKESYKKIKNHDFENGCGEEDCRWCKFVSNNFSLEESLEQYEEVDR